LLEKLKDFHYCEVIHAHNRRQFQNRLHLSLFEGFLGQGGNQLLIVYLLLLTHIASRTIHVVTPLKQDLTKPTHVVVILLLAVTALI
jgi:hypothetical protein